MNKDVEQPDTPEEITPDAETAETAANMPGIEVTESELDLAKRDLADARQKLLYLQADYQNYRKRMVKELADARALGVASTLQPFLQVFDFLTMARQAAEKSDNIDAIKQGVVMIIGEYTKAFDELGVVRPKSVGAPFDPAWQEAVSQEPSDTVPEGSVVKEWSAAYRIGERLLRPAKVVVSTGKAKVEEA